MMRICYYDAIGYVLYHAQSSLLYIYIYIVTFDRQRLMLPRSSISRTDLRSDVKEVINVFQSLSCGMRCGAHACFLSPVKYLFISQTLVLSICSRQ